MAFLREVYLRLRWFGRPIALSLRVRRRNRSSISRAGLRNSRAPVYRAPKRTLRARREFGSRLKAAEDSSGAWQMRWLEDLASDLRYAARAFRRNPGFALTAICCLALGIGANTAIFNITTSFLFSQPSCRDSASLIAIWEGGNSAGSLSDLSVCA